MIFTGTNDFTHLKSSPNVVVEWLTLHVQEFPGSNLGPETGCLD
jgi:hypothetical protein